MKRFDLNNASLTGPVLIEASAGTGKTYSITGLFVRLIVEQGLSVDQILVVTYTTAATQELKTRIRQRLILTREGIARGAGDDFVARLLDECSDRNRALQQIDSALADFDRAAIFTIHGFCQRLLLENSFETGTHYDTGLVADPTAYFQEVAEDFWRRFFYKAEPEFIGYVSDATAAAGPHIFCRLLRNINMADLDVLPHFDEAPLINCDEYRKYRRQLAAHWRGCRSEIIEQLMSPALNARIFGSLKSDRRQPELSQRDVKIRTLAAAMDRFCRPKTTGFPPFKGFEKFSDAYLKKATKKRGSPPRHPFFVFCRQLSEAAEVLATEMAAYFLYLKTAFINYSRSELAVIKHNRNIQFYDDLLLTVKNALDRSRPGSDRLVETVEKRFKTALVDEFQDTDAIQYDIFSRLFGKPPALLFMIGDPKQSIYSFRGADIFSYMEAASRTASRYTLIENWRSSPGLISAVNTLFGNVPSPFLYKEIGFEKGRAGQPRSDETVSKSPALSLWFLSSEDRKPISKSDALRRITTAVGREIARLVTESPQRIGPADIAILVRTNRQARMMKECLSKLQIPSVLYGAGDIFDTHEAGEMQQLLTGILENANENRFRAALVTDLLGLRANDLDTDVEDTASLDERRARFREYRALWHRSGFMTMFRRLMSREGVRARLLAYNDGDRRLTNILHIAEIIHHQEMENSAEAVDIIRWYSDHRQAGTPRIEEHQLRLENDHQAVHIVTIHKSKGLEYPMVFCPFGWESAINAREPDVICHSIGPPRRRILDLGSSHYDAHTRNAQKEKLAENLRLLYVALTRAKSDCVLVWGRINTAETSALAYLLHRPPALDAETDIVNALKTHLSQLSDIELMADLEHLVERSEGSIALMELPHGDVSPLAPGCEAAQPLSCRSFGGTIDTSWKISSYSSLVSRRQENADLPDYDSPWILPTEEPDAVYSPPPITVGENRTIFDFPRGTRAGIFFHSLLETLDFTASDPEYRDHSIRDNLRLHGFDLQWQEPVGATIQQVLTVPLLNGNDRLILGGIGPRERINELAFTFPLKPFTRTQLLDAFDRHKGRRIPEEFPMLLERLDFTPSGGFLKGFIDMVFRYEGRFYLLDWKSNHLGRNTDDYHVGKLQPVMSASYYILQYCLYTLALHRYLSLRQPSYSYSQHFGGVFYVFIRGIDSARGPDFGIYHDRPDVALIRALDSILIARA